MTTSFKKQLQRLLCAGCALAVLLSTLLPLTALAAGDGALAADTLSAADAENMQAADEAVAALTDSDEYGEMSDTERYAAALDELQQLADKGLVRRGSIYTDEENGIISYTYACGALGGIMLDEPADEDVNDYLVSPEENGILELSGNKYEFLGKAAIYYAFDDLISSNRYPYYAYMQAFWTTMGLSTELKTSVTVADMRRMDDYDLCVISTHGSYYTYSTGRYTKRLRTEPVIILLEESTMPKDLLYGFDLLTHRVIKINGKYCLTPSFFRAAYSGGQLDGTIILSETCEFLGISASVDSSMPEAMLAGGARAVVGYVNNVYTIYSRSVTWDIVNKLITGQSLGQSLEHALSTYGADDLIWYNSKGGKRPHSVASYAKLYGDYNASLRSAAEYIAAA